MISPIRNEDLVLKVTPSQDSKKQIEKYDAFLDLVFDEEYYFLREAAYNILYFLFQLRMIRIAPPASDKIHLCLWKLQWTSA